MNRVTTMTLTGLTTTASMIWNYPLTAIGITFFSTQLFPQEITSRINQVGVNIMTPILNATGEVTKSSIRGIVVPLVKESVSAATEVLMKGGQDFNSDITPTLEKFGNQVIVPMVKEGTKLSAEAVAGIAKAIIKSTFEGFKETLNLPSMFDGLNREAPSHAIGPVELLIEKVKEYIDLSAMWKGIQPAPQTVVVTAALTAIGSLSYIAYRRGLFDQLKINLENHDDFIV